MRPGLMLSALAALEFAALSPSAAAGPLRSYQDCASLAQSDPQAAYNQALAWHSAGGGAAAEHCEALSLTGLDRYSEAAPLLDSLGRDLTQPANVRAQFFIQAGNTWLLAEDSARAELSFTNALSFLPNDVDTLADRSRARAMRKDWAGADADLTAALARDPNRTDLLVLRASARHAEGLKREARADIDRALEIFPNYGDALVERGAMKYEDGDAAGAQADWRRVIALAPRSRAAALAGEYLTETQAPVPAKP